MSEKAPKTAERRREAPGPTGRFPDQVVMITGAAGQIGSCCVTAFLNEGARVVGVDAGEVAASEPSDRYLPVTCDLTRPESIENVFAVAEHAYGPVTVLVHCAAVYRRSSFLELNASDLDAIFAVNVRALLLLASRAARTMAAKGIRGRIVNLTSVSAVVSDAQSVGYEASKGAVSMATRGMAVALAPYGIRVNAVGPGEMVKSQEITTIRGETELDEYERRRIPSGRLVTGAQVADAVTFLASDAAASVTGQILYVDGGALATWSALETPKPADVRR
jgi:glucose 1-dehydrogenase